MAKLFKDVPHALATAGRRLRRAVGAPRRPGAPLMIGTPRPSVVATAGARAPLPGLISPGRALLLTIAVLASMVLLAGWAGAASFGEPLSLLVGCLLLMVVLLTTTLLVLDRIGCWLSQRFDILCQAAAAWDSSDALELAQLLGEDSVGRLPWGLRRAALALDRLTLALHLARQAFVAIAEHGDTWESWVGRDGRLRWVSRSVLAITGYSPAECLAMADYPYPLIHPEDHERFERMRAGESGAGDELRVRTRSGETRQVRLSWRWVRGESGEELGLRLSVVDLGRRPAQPRPLPRASEALPERTAGPLGHWEWSLDEDSLSWSDEIYPIFGLDPREFRVSYPAMLERIFPEDRPRVVAALVSALNGDAPYRVEHRILRSDGTVRHVLKEGRTERDADGAPRRLYGIVQDITDSEQARQALSRINRLYAVLCEVNKAMVGERDPQALFGRVCRIIVDHGDLQLAWIGTADAEGAWLAPAAVAGMAAGCVRDRRFSLADAGAGSEPGVEALLSGATRVHQDLAAEEAGQPWRQRAAEWGLRSLVALPLRQDGEVVACLVVHSWQAGYFSADMIQLLEALADDVSFALQALAQERRRRQAESELLRLHTEFEVRVAERTRALQAANGELEAFSYSVSHDLRAPLRRIDGFSRLLQEQHGGQLSAVGHDYLGRIRRSSQRMGQLIDDLLKLSQIGRQALQPAEVCLSTLAAAVLDELRQAEPGRALEVHIESGLKVCADARLMRIVLENLLGNAWKFSAGRPGARVRFGRDERDGERVLYVLDNGAGFDERYVDRLFKPFQRLHSASEFEGTGIGLATVQRIILRHGGRIWAEGRVGEGATFFFMLP